MPPVKLQEQVVEALRFLAMSSEQMLSFLPDSEEDVWYTTPGGDPDIAWPTEVALSTTFSILRGASVTGEWPGEALGTLRELHCTVEMMLELAAYGADYVWLLDKHRYGMSGPFDDGWQVLRTLARLALAAAGEIVSSPTMSFLNFIALDGRRRVKVVRHLIEEAPSEQCSPSSTSVLPEPAIESLRFLALSPRDKGRWYPITDSDNGFVAPFERDVNEVTAPGHAAFLTALWMLDEAVDALSDRAPQSLYDVLTELLWLMRVMESDTHNDLWWRSNEQGLKSWQLLARLAALALQEAGADVTKPTLSFNAFIRLAGFQRFRIERVPF